MTHLLPSFSSGRAGVPFAGVKAIAFTPRESAPSAARARIGPFGMRSAAAGVTSSDIPKARTWSEQRDGMWVVWVVECCLLTKHTEMNLGDTDRFIISSTPALARGAATGVTAVQARGSRLDVVSRRPPPHPRTHAHFLLATPRAPTLTATRPEAPPTVLSS